MLCLKSTFHLYCHALSHEQEHLLQLLRRQMSPDVGRLVSELCGHEGEILLHLNPEVGFGDAAVVCMDGMDTGHFPRDQSDR